MTIFENSHHNDEVRRRNLFAGDIYTFSPRASTLALCNFAKEMIETAFGGIDPLRAQHEMPVERYVEICAPLKPTFIHHPRTKGLLRDIMEELQCDLETTYQDVPRLRMVTSDGYLTSGVGYAHHPHRDTWYSAPMCQLNWWLPIYEFETEASMAFHPNYWSNPIENGSGDFNYYEWNSVGRKNAAQQIHSDTRKQPKPTAPMELEPQVRVVCPPGGVILFSAAQMHSTVPNTSGIARYSIDFRTANRADIEAIGGARNIDSRCTGTSLRDFVRSMDFSALPEQVVAKYDDAPNADGLILTFDGEVARNQFSSVDTTNTNSQ